MAQGSGGFDLNSTYKIVRELLQDENLPEEDIRVFMRSQMFLELCPDLHSAFISSEKVQAESENLPGTSKKQINEPKPGHSRNVTSSDNIKKQTDGNHPKKKTKLFLCSDSDDSSNKPQKKTEEVRKKKKTKILPKVKSRSSSTSSAGSAADRKHLYKQKDGKKTKIEESEKEAPKIHPFYLGKMGPILQPKGKLFQSENEQAEEEERAKERERERIRKKKRQDEIVQKKKPPEVRAPKPWTFYNRASAKIARGTKSWKPYTAQEFSRKQRRHKLKLLSVVCVDLLNLDTFFYNEDKKGPPCSTSVPLKRHMNISSEKADMIERLEKLKREAFKPVLNKLYANGIKDRRTSRDCASSTDGERGRKEKKSHNQRRVMNSSSDSSSDPIVPKRGGQQSSRDRGGHSSKDKMRKGSAEWKAEQRKKQLDTIKAKAEKEKRGFKSQGARKLPWEDPQYFGHKKDPKRDKKDEKLTPKEREKKRLEERLKAQANAPAVSFQKILAQIESANKQAENKPPVALKIPKLSDRKNEYVKPSRPIKPGDVATEVTKLLASESNIDVPVMPSNTVDLADYTIRKMAWWFLKSEKEPRDEVLVHPEHHDDEIMEPWFNNSDGGESDGSSIGCVSDPEGLNKCQVNEITSSVIDGDVADEYCGLSSLEARIRKHVPGSNMDKDVFKAFFKVRPGSNYEKANFEAKCFICDEKVVGQRQLGAHIRSKGHKNHFRNHSLDLASYDEQTTPVPYKKVFIAKLVQHSVENSNSTVAGDSSESIQKKTEIKMQTSDSPRAVIDGEDDSPEIVEVQDIPEDELSLPSLTMFDLRADEDQLKAKFALKSAGKWSDEMEERWKLMQQEEMKITDSYNDRREEYINAPNTHPFHDQEWLKFWDRRSCELEADGKNPDHHDFASEWVVFWLKRMQEIMKEEVEKQILGMKQNLRLDVESLSHLLQRAGLKLDIDDGPRTKKADSSVDPKPSNNIIPAEKKPHHSHEVQSSRKDSAPKNVKSSTAAPIRPQEKQIKQEKSEPTNAKVKVENPIIKGEKAAEGNNKIKEKVDSHKEIKKEIEEDVKVKKPPVAPPPPKISQESKGPTQSSSRTADKGSPKDSRGKSRTTTDSKHRVDRRDSRDERRRISPDDGKSRRHHDKDNRRRDYRRSRSRERHGKKEQRDRRHRDSSSGSEPKSKRRKDDTRVHNNKGDVASSSRKPNSSDKVEVKVEQSENKPKDLAMALEQLREAIEFVEPIISTPLSEPTEIENCSETGALLDGSLINTSVEMEIEDSPKVCPPQISILPNPEDLQAVSPENRSSPEEGELDSSVSSVGSMKVDRKKKKKKKAKKSPIKDSDLAPVSDEVSEVSEVPLHPSPSKFDPGSIGFHLLAKQWETNSSDRPRLKERSSIESSSDRRHHRNSVEEELPIHYKERRRKSRDNQFRSKTVELSSDDDNSHKQYRKGKNSWKNGKVNNAYKPAPVNWGSKGPQGSKNHKWVNKNAYPTPPSAQAFMMEESWEPDGDPIPLPKAIPPVLPPQPPPLQLPPPPPVLDDWDSSDFPTGNQASPTENWEDESWVVSKDTAKGNNLLPITAKSRNVVDDAPYSPTWDESSNDKISQPVDVPRHSVVDSSGVPDHSLPQQGKGKMRKGPRGGRKAKKHHKNDAAPAWNTNPNFMPISIPPVQQNFQHGNIPVPNFSNAFNNPNYINQGYSNPNPNPQPPGFPQYQQGFGEYQFNWL